MTKENDEFLNIEYSEISSYFRNVINFRFTVFGFYIATLGIVITSPIEVKTMIFTLIITFLLFSLEMRNRSLSKILEDREKEIEEILCEGDRQDSSCFFHRLENIHERFGGRFLFWEFKNIPIYERKKTKEIIFFPKYEHLEKDSYIYFLFSHSFVIDISYLLVFILSLIKLIKLIVAK